MGTFFIIAIIAFVIFVMVQLTDISPAECITYNYKGLYFGDDSSFEMRPVTTSFSIQNKFITINTPFAEPIKMRILKNDVHSKANVYTCMDGHRNQHIIIRSKMNDVRLDAIMIAHAGFYEIYSNNQNFKEDLDKVYSLYNLFDL